MNLLPSLEDSPAAQLLMQYVPLEQFKLVQVSDGEYVIGFTEDGIGYSLIIDDDELYVACQRLLLNIGAPVEQVRPASRRVH